MPVPCTGGTPHTCSWLNCPPSLRYPLLTGQTSLTLICLLFFSAAFMLESQTQVLTARFQDPIPTIILKGHCLEFEFEFNPFLRAEEASCVRSQPVALGCMVCSMCSSGSCQPVPGTAGTGTSLSPLLIQSLPGCGSSLLLPVSLYMSLTSFL